MFDRTTERLSTGKEVNNVVDNAVAFFTSKSLEDRAGIFLDRKEFIDQGISTLQASLDAVEGVEEFLDQMKGIAEAAKSQTQEERTSSTLQFNEVANQLSLLIEDSEYNGNNLLSDTNNTLEIRMSERSQSRLVFQGFDLNSTEAADASATYGSRDVANLGTQLFSSAAFKGNAEANAFKGMSVLVIGIEDEIEGLSDPVNGFSNLGDNNSALAIAERLITTLDDTTDRLRGMSAELGTYVSILQTRSDFTETYTDTLLNGADKLTLADINEEGANLVSLQTSQQLAIQSLAISGQQRSSILALF